MSQTLIAGQIILLMIFILAAGCTGTPSLYVTDTTCDDKFTGYLHNNDPVKYEDVTVKFKILDADGARVYYNYISNLEIYPYETMKVSRIITDEAAGPYCATIKTKVYLNNNDGIDYPQYGTILNDAIKVNNNFKYDQFYGEPILKSYFDNTDTKNHQVVRLRALLYKDGVKIYSVTKDIFEAEAGERVAFSLAINDEIADYILNNETISIKIIPYTYR